MDTNIQLPAINDPKREDDPRVQRAICRRKQLDASGPTEMLELLQGTKGKRRRLDWADSDFWIRLANIADNDSEWLLRCPLWEGDDFADAVFKMPGFIVAAHIHPDALFGYLRLLLQNLWPGDKHFEARHELTLWLFRAFRRRERLPMAWNIYGWQGLC